MKQIGTDAVGDPICVLRKKERDTLDSLGVLLSSRRLGGPGGDETTDLQPVYDRVFELIHQLTVILGGQQISESDIRMGIRLTYSVKMDIAPEAAPPSVDVSGAALVRLTIGPRAVSNQISISGRIMPYDGGEPPSLPPAEKGREL